MEELTDVEFIQGIKKAIKLHGMTLAEVAARLPVQRNIRDKNPGKSIGVSQATLSNLLSDESGNPGYKSMKAIANILGISFAQLVFEVSGFKCPENSAASSAVRCPVCGSALEVETEVRLKAIDMENP